MCIVFQYHQYHALINSHTHTSAQYSMIYSMIQYIHDLHPISFLFCFGHVNIVCISDLSLCSPAVLHVVLKSITPLYLRTFI